MCPNGEGEINGAGGGLKIAIAVSGVLLPNHTKIRIKLQSPRHIWKNWDDFSIVKVGPLTIKAAGIKGFNGHQKMRSC
jgi:hypothetical protein